jgi:hypothetical protein
VGSVSSDFFFGKDGVVRDIEASESESEDVDVVDDPEVDSDSEDDDTEELDELDDDELVSAPDAGLDDDVDACRFRLLEFRGVDPRLVFMWDKPDRGLDSLRDMLLVGPDMLRPGIVSIPLLGVVSVTSILRPY